LAKAEHSPSSRSGAAGTLICLLAGLLLLAACEGEDKTPEKPLTAVRVQVLTSQDHDNPPRYSANIVAKVQVDIAFKVNGYITALAQRKGVDGKARALQQGDSVKKDDFLAQVQKDDYENKVKGAKAQLAEAAATLQQQSADFKRAKQLFDSQSITAQEFDRDTKNFQTATASVAGAKAQLDEAELNLKNTALSSPLAGLVLQRNIEVGTLVAPGTVGYVVGDVSGVKAVFGVPSSVLPAVKLGDSLTVTIESLSGQSFAGKVTTIAPAADTSSRVFEVEVSLDNPDNELKVGMIANLSLATAHLQPFTLVPLNAVLRAKTDPNGYAVMLLEDAKDGPVVRLQDVKLGAVHGDNIAVIDGVKAGEKVVVVGATLVHDGERVQVIP
jgi:RND family efflux transporter MFP subunit